MNNFRNYATRVSFNLSFSRQQMAALWAIANHIETFPSCESWSRDVRKKHFDLTIDMFVPSAHWLERNGFVVFFEPTEMSPKWSKPSWQLTEAGTCALRLLELAELVPVRAKAKRAA